MLALFAKGKSCAETLGCPILASHFCFRIRFCMAMQAMLFGSHPPVLPWLGLPDWGHSAMGSRVLQSSASLEMLRNLYNTVSPR